VLDKHHSSIHVGAGLIQFVYGSHSRWAADLIPNTVTFSSWFSRAFFWLVPKKESKKERKTYTRNRGKKSADYISSRSARVANVHRKALLDHASGTTEIFGFSIFPLGHRRFHSKGSKERWRGETRVILYLCERELGVENSCWPSLRESCSNMFRQTRDDHCLCPSAPSFKSTCRCESSLSEKKEKNVEGKTKLKYKKFKSYGHDQEKPSLGQSHCAGGFSSNISHCWFHTSSFDGTRLNTVKEFWRKFQDDSLRAHRASSKATRRFLTVIEATLINGKVSFLMFIPWL